MGVEGPLTQPRGRGRDTTHGSDWHEGACCGRGGALWAVALTGHGALELDGRGHARSGLVWGGLPHPAPSHCAARPAQAGPLWSWAEEALPSPGKGGSGPGEASVAQSTGAFSVVPEPGRLGWEEEGASVRAAAAAANATLLAKPHGVQGRWERGTLPKKGCRSLSHAGGPGVRETTGPLVYRLAGGQVSAGLCPCYRRGRGGKIQVASLPCGLPWAGEHRATQLGCGHRAGGGPTPRGTIPGEGAGGPLGAAALLAWEDTGAGWPLGAGPRVAGQWLGGRQREPRQAGPLPGGWARLGPQDITIITK